MKHKRTITIFIIGALAVAMTFGAVAYNSVLAATPITTAAGTSPQTSMGLGKGLPGGIGRDDLAAALGITVDELNTAYQTAYSAALSQAVSQGLITQAQADELTTNGRAFPFGGRWEDYLSTNGIDFNALLADALKISADELKTAYQTAFYARIDQAVTDGNITQEKADLLKGKYALFNDSSFQSNLQSAFTNAVNQAVASGVITQSQADQILSSSTNMFSNGGMGGFGGHRGHGGERMGGDFLPDVP